MKTFLLRRLTRRTALGASLLFAFGAPAVQAQGWPDRPIKFIVPTTPGSAGDVLGRVLAETMNRTLNATIVVENKAGADQIIGLEHVAKGAPVDGYTVAVVGIDGQALLPITKKGLRFDPRKDLTLVAGIAEGRYVLAGPASAPYRNLKEFVQAAKAAPGKFNYGASGPVVRIPMLILMRDMGIDMVHVPFRGGGPYSAELAAGTLQLGFLSESSARPLASRLRFYGVTGSTRSPGNPDVPTLAEQGVSGVYGPAYGLAVRAGTPKAVVDKLSAAAAAAMESPEFKARTHGLLFAFRYDNAEMAQRLLDERVRAYQEIARRVGLEAE
ncbi:MAG TPA: tripartite tricarboxylate transporter substrate binding protein [Ramlibacter sp.]|nr:tripartite tricarboxylate transporter substrate binding protein [Ramlibacter sp.]